MSHVVDQTRTGLLRAVGWGTLAVGLLDVADGVVFFGLHDRMNPIQVLQYIASGAFGAGAFAGGIPAALAGLVIHFFLAFVFTAARPLERPRMPLGPQRRCGIRFNVSRGVAQSDSVRFWVRTPNHDDTRHTRSNPPSVTRR